MPTPRIVYCTHSSQEKDDDPGLLPAHKRYTGTHVKRVELIAAERSIPFYILSGIHGFISWEEQIPYYEHLLKSEEVLPLVDKLCVQLEKVGMEKLHYFTKTTSEERELYVDALKAAVAKLYFRQIELTVRLLPNDA
jgi:hypothetical protein